MNREKKIQTYRLVDNAGNFLITLEQNAKASGSNYNADGHLFSNIKERVWKDFPDLKVFEEGYNKDYIYENALNISPLNKTNNNFEFDLKSNSNSDNISKHGGRRRLILLTMRGAIKFNMWKRTEGGKMIASALIEMDYKMILQVKDEKTENICK